MFNELKQLLQTRDLVLTLCAVEGDQIRVTVNPKPKGKESKEKDESKVLTVPFVLEGSADELDAEFARTVTEYKTTVQSTEDSIAAFKAEAEAAVKAVKEEAAQKVKDAKKAAAPAKPYSSAKSEPARKIEPSPPPSLFDAQPEPIANVKVAAPEAPPVVPATGTTHAFLVEDIPTADFTQEVNDHGAQNLFAAS